MTAVAYSFPSGPAVGAPLVLVPQAPSQAAVYRRRRLVVAASLVAIALVLGFTLKAAVDSVISNTSDEPALIATVLPAGATQWTVQSGDTLWSIATATHPGEDPRPVVARMQSAGASTQLQVGDTITVP